ncbi:MAG: hypothetical protein NW223_06535 [Hyphomicrobiaceae bacterium]|nr:hypothetical protein [Hyphomicrobiaceae bacterium]
MSYQRDPNAQPRPPRTGTRGAATGMLPTILGVVFLLLVGLLAYNMYTGAETAPSSLNPSAQAPTNTSPSNTSPPNVAPAPKTTTPPNAAPGAPATPQ